VPVLHYSDLVPAMQTDVPGVLLANTTQIVNSTLNNNAMVQIARDAVTQVTRHAAMSLVSSTAATIAIPV
jgi:hypothetical protein